MAITMIVKTSDLSNHNRSVLIVNRIDPLCANKIDPHGNKNNKL